MIRKLFKWVCLVVVISILISLFFTYKIDKYQNRNTPISAIYDFYSRMEKETGYKVVLSTSGSYISASELPESYRIYICLVSLFNKFDYPGIREELNSYSFLISNSNEYSFSLLARTINNRVFDIEIVYDDCSLKNEIDDWIAYFRSNLGEVQGILNCKCSIPQSSPDAAKRNP